MFQAPQPTLPNRLQQHLKLLLPVDKITQVVKQLRVVLGGKVHPAKI